ncbi:lipocalin-like domain-containing protein [Polaribacter sp.]|uniref:lipocalin-like domain-containing protein n=1 Tax=Polaribacter sp. TaxID=1920175 RepID=UPI003F6B793F
MSLKTKNNMPLRGLSNTQLSNITKDKLDKEVYISLPKDMYLHTPKTDTNKDGCPTEWWWHIGTLKTNTGKVFGFEINACAIYPYGFTEVMLTDVQSQKHYHQTVPGIPISGLWAESDPNKDWFVALENVLMRAPQEDLTQNMVVNAKLEDNDTIVDFDLKFSQNGKPLIVWGDGATPVKPPQTKPTLKDNNFYFSLTRLQASGTISISTKNTDLMPEKHEVTGVTWMDHEWGKFSNKNGKKVKWILQDMQFENGICISNYSLTGPKLNESTQGMATVQISKKSDSTYVQTTITPKKSTLINGKEYFTEIYVEIPDYKIEATVTSLMPDQLFKGGIYEGVGIVSGSILEKNNMKRTSISGTAWVEQNIQ